MLNPPEDRSGLIEFEDKVMPGRVAFGLGGIIADDGSRWAEMVTESEHARF